METQNQAVKSMEKLISKVAESNTVMISEITKFLGQIGSSKINFKELMALEKNIINDTVHKVINLNTKYASDIIEILVDITKKLNQNNYKTNGYSQPATQTTDTAKAVFEIKTTGYAGGTATTAFLLNSANSKPLNCKINYSEFVMEDIPVTKFNADISFDPQLFQMVQGEARRINALIRIPAAIVPGIYRNQVTVDGFEDTFFDIVLQVMAPKTAEETANVKNGPILKASRSLVKKATPKKTAITKKKKSPAKKIT